MKRIFSTSFYIFYTVFISLSCASPASNEPVENLAVVAENENSHFSFQYDLTSPETVHELPAILDEISGLTVIDSAHVACLQDELGIIFIYDFVKDSIVFTHQFDSKGDFEGITFTGNSLYILRSDGRLSIFKNFDPFADNEQITHKQLSLESKDNEGLCFDTKNNCLLVSAKSKPINHDYKSERFIYKYDLIKEALSKSPAYKINIHEVKKACEKFNVEINTELNKKGKAKPFNFRPSAIAIHPNNELIFILSASDKLFLAMNRDKTILHIEKLDEKLFPKAEGISFLENGTLLISNEGDGKTPTILVFRQKE